MPGADSPRTPTPEQLEDFEERAAIREYLGNMPREEAERLAARDVGLDIVPARSLK